MNKQLNALRRVFTLLESDSTVRSATCFIDPKQVVTLTRRHKPDKRSRYTEYVLNVGQPNFAGRKFVKVCQKAGEPFPVKKLRIKHYVK